jgi:hypothetical protein
MQSFHIMAFNWNQSSHVMEMLRQQTQTSGLLPTIRILVYKVWIYKH